MNTFTTEQFQEVMSTHMTTPIHVKCALLNPFGFGAQRTKMHLASHCFFSRPIRFSQRRSLGLHYLHTPLGTKNLALCGTLGTLSQTAGTGIREEIQEAILCHSREENGFSGFLPREQTSMYCTMLALPKPRQGKRSQRP